MTQRNSNLIALTTAALVVVALTGGVATVTEPTAAQSSPYDVSISFPGQFTTGEGQTIAVTVNATDGDVFNPVIEIPILSSFSVSSTALNNAYVKLPNGSTDGITAERDTSTFRGGNAIFLFGEEVTEGTSRTYYINVTVQSPGQKIVEADVRPLYNNSINVRSKDTVTALGFGNITVIVQRPDGSKVSDASVKIDGSVVSGANRGVKLLEGTHTAQVSVSSNNLPLPEFTVNLSIGENQTVIYTIPRTLSEPTVIATTRSAEVIGPSISNSTRSATAIANKKQSISFIINANGGNTTVAIPLSSTFGPVTNRSISVDSGSATVSVHGSIAIVNLTADSDVTVSIQRTGFKLGDQTGDGQVDAQDAREVADAVVDGESTSQYADVNQDGKITAVDAMLIAQYSQGNRGPQYERRN